MAASKITGAETGATPLTARIITSAFAKSRPAKLSVEIERERTMPPAAPRPCMKRQVLRNSMVGEKIQATVEAAEPILNK